MYPSIFNELTDVHISAAREYLSRPIEASEDFSSKRIFNLDASKLQYAQCAYIIMTTLTLFSSLIVFSAQLSCMNVPPTVLTEQHLPVLRSTTDLFVKSLNLTHLMHAPYQGGTYYIYSAGRDMIRF